MKRIIALFLALAILCCTVACADPKEKATEKAQKEALEKATIELKYKLKNPSSLVINDAVFYFPDYDEENETMSYAAVKLDYNATNSYGGSVRDTYICYLVDITDLTPEQIMHINGINLR